MMFNIKYSSQSKRFLIKNDKLLVKRILDKIEKLKQDQIIPDSKKIKNQNLFRIRIGKYRVLYEIDYKNLLVGIIRIDKRSKVYNS